MKCNLLRLGLSGAVLCSAFLASPESLLAQSQEESDTTKVLITPRRGGVRQSSVGSAVTVISSSEIERSGRRSVAEILRTVPGLEIARQGGMGRLTSVFLRGAESDQTLVLIDGVRVNSAADGAFDLADLRLDNVERIEIVKGPQSVQYGSEAIGGVISIITKQASSDGFAGGVSLQAGSYSTQDYQANASYRDDEQGISSITSASYYRTEGISVAVPRLGNSENDGYENINLSNRTTLEFSNDISANIFARYLHGNAELDGFEFGTGPVDDRNFSQLRDLVTGGFRIQKASGIVRPSIELGVTYEEIEGKDPDTVFNNYDITNLVFSPQAHVEFVPTKWSNTQIGYTFEQRATENQGSFDESRQVHGFVADQRLRLSEGVWLSGGMRHDRYSDFGTQNTYQTTLSGKIPNSGIRLHTSFGTGFKAPSFNELYFPNFGNVDLAAEESTGYDFGIEYTGDWFQNDLTFFKTEISDLITFSSDTFVAENISSGWAQGFEETFSMSLSSAADLGVGYTYTDSENIETGQLLPRRPKHRFTATLSVRPLQDLEMTANFLLVNDRIDSDLAPLDDYEKLDLVIRYTRGPVVPFVRLDNVFDEDYEEVRGYGTRGFAVLGGFELSSW